MVLALAGCDSTAESARKKALAQLQRDAAAMQVQAGFTLAKASTPEAALRELADYYPSVLETEVVGPGSVAWTAVFVAKGIDGGGLDYHDADLRACLRYTGRLGARPGVRWSSTPRCPPPGRKPRYGPWEETVELEPE